MNLRTLIVSSALLGAGASVSACHGTSQQPANSPSAARSADGLTERGRWWIARGDLVRAADYLSLALDAGAAPQVILPLLMRTYIESGRFRVAIALGEELLRRQPDDIPLRLLVATLSAGIGNTVLAQQHLSRVLHLDPANPEAHFALARLLRDDVGDLARADLHFRRYLQLAPAGAHSPEARSSLFTEVPSP
jgi:tetratricopeptide (TPR) repeat protein